MRQLLHYANGNMMDFQAATTHKEGNEKKRENISKFF